MFVYKLRLFQESGCGTVGSAVKSVFRGPASKRLRQIVFYNIGPWWHQPSNFERVQSVIPFLEIFFRAFCSHKNGAKFRNNEVGKTHFVKLYIFWRNPGFSELLKMEHFQSLLFIFRHFHKQRNGKINFLMEITTIFFVFFSPFKNHYKFKAKKC